MPNRHRYKCLHCKQLFVPNLRNWWHQKYCTQPECRKASKTESQRQWLSKPENRDVFRGSPNVERVRQWRDENPGYWKRPAKPRRTLQELVAAPVPTQAPENKEVAPNISSPPLPTASPPLQDFVQSQDPLVLGLISHLIDSPLQEVVEQAARRLLQKGHDILNLKFGMQMKGNTYADNETSALPGAVTKSSGAVQLGGSAPGAPALP